MIPDDAELCHPSGFSCFSISVMISIVLTLTVQTRISRSIIHVTQKVSAAVIFATQHKLNAMH